VVPERQFEQPFYVTTDSSVLIFRELQTFTQQGQLLPAEPMFESPSPWFKIGWTSALMKLKSC